MAKYKIHTTMPCKAYIKIKYEVEASCLVEAIKKVQITECVDSGAFKADIPDGVYVLEEHNIVEALYDEPDKFGIMGFTVFIDDLGKEKSVDCSELDDLITQEDFETHFNLPKQ
jgi:hypothetical protein